MADRKIEIILLLFVIVYARINEYGWVEVKMSTYSILVYNIFERDFCVRMRFQK